MARTGTVCYFAGVPAYIRYPLNLHDLYMKEGRIQTVFTNDMIMPRTIDLLRRLQLDQNRRQGHAA
jgi:(R,R)-butanediol dehydrogenase/meso-butanediol dehydrogenase/diacetyl reductase